MADIKKLSLLASAKINPFLEVSKKREDGYHDIITVMQSVSLYDEIELTADTELISVSVETHPELSGEGNIVYGAIKKFFELSGLKSCASAVIKKNIPISAGLGGGSADAAAVLKGLNRLYGGVLSENELLMLESKLHLAQRFEALRRRCAYEAVQIESAAEALSDGASKESLLRSASFLKSIPI